VIRACQDAKQKICKLAESRVEVNAENLEVAGGKVYPKERPDWVIGFNDLFSFGVAQGIGEILGTADYKVEHTDPVPGTGYSPKGAPSWSYIAYGLEVAVNTENGEIRVLRAGCAVDIGQPINWKMCEGQIEGSIGMGIGCTLFEKFEVSNGKILNPNLVTYKIPTFMECPSGEMVKIASVGLPHPDGPYGAKALGEMGLVPFSAAIGNAVFDAVGVRITNAPLTRERVFKHLREAKKCLV
jgi:xanthine dehydrogenase molybdenum-binding subunit